MTAGLCGIDVQTWTRLEQPYDAAMERLARPGGARSGAGRRLKERRASRLGLLRFPPGGREGRQGDPCCWRTEEKGHIVARLLMELSDAPPELLVEKGRVLDSYYLPTRSPRSHADGAAYEHYGALQSEQGLRFAGDILQFVRESLTRNSCEN